MNMRHFVTTSTLLIVLLFTGLNSASASSLPKVANPNPLPASRVKAMLRAMPEKWQGVRYRFGGTTRRGIDCSAFVQAVYKDVFAIDIPRNTGGQSGVGQSVSRSNMIPGDIILFYSRFSGSKRHVGIYVGDNQFLHISSGRNAVVIANLTSYDGAPGLRVIGVRRVANVVDDSEFNYEENFKPIVASDTMKEIVKNGQFAF
jgi:cell wall-associated NlpC family hydrolase